MQPTAGRRTVAQHGGRGGSRQCTVSVIGWGGVPRLKNVPVTPVPVMLFGSCNPPARLREEAAEAHQVGVVGARCEGRSGRAVRPIARHPTPKLVSYRMRNLASVTSP